MLIFCLCQSVYQLPYLRYHSLTNHNLSYHYFLNVHDSSVLPDALSVSIGREHGYAFGSYLGYIHIDERYLCARLARVDKNFNASS